MLKAIIEAAGKMRLGVEKLHNTNEHLKTQLVETGRERIVDYEAFDDTNYCEKARNMN